jgi:hypothetical protein
MNKCVIQHFLNDKLAHFYRDSFDQEEGSNQDLRNNYTEQLQILLLDNIPKDIINSIIIKYLIDNCQCCHTLVCCKLSSTKMRMIFEY